MFGHSDEIISIDYTSFSTLILKRDGTLSIYENICELNRQISDVNEVYIHNDMISFLTKNRKNYFFTDDENQQCSLIFQKKYKQKQNTLST